jgi:hypothetical protein
MTTNPFVFGRPESRPLDWNWILRDDAANPVDNAPGAAAGIQFRSRLSPTVDLEPPPIRFSAPPIAADERMPAPLSTTGSPDHAGLRYSVPHWAQTAGTAKATHDAPRV